MSSSVFKHLQLTAQLRHLALTRGQLSNLLCHAGRELRGFADRLACSKRSFKRGNRFGGLGQRILQLRHACQQLPLPKLPRLRHTPNVRGASTHISAGAIGRAFWASAKLLATRSRSFWSVRT
jgi:hypothetical protein